MMQVQTNKSTQRNVFAVEDADFEEKVLKSDLPVIVDFWGPFCPPCRALAPFYERLSNEYVGTLRFATMNTGENIDIPSRMRVQATPTLMLFRAGKAVGQIVGPTPSRLKRAIDTLLAE